MCAHLPLPPAPTRRLSELELAQVSSLLTSKLKYFDSMREKWGSATLALAYSRPDVFGARSRANDALLRRRVDWYVTAWLAEPT